MLLNLPPELILLVLQNTSTPAYLQAAVACRALYEIATSCHSLVLHHLYQTPGVITGVHSLETKELFQLLIKRSFRQLYGAEFRASCKAFDFESQEIDVQASSLAPSGDTSLALVVKDQPGVFLFHAQDEGVLSPRARLRVPEQHEQQQRLMQVLKTTVHGECDVYALCRFTPLVDEDGPDADHPFVQQARHSSHNVMIALFHFEIQSPGHIRTCYLPDHVEYDALAFAVADRDTFAISWQHPRNVRDWEVVLYTVTDEVPDEESNTIDLRYNSSTIVDQNSQRPRDPILGVMLNASNPFPLQPGPVIDLCFNDRSSQLLYYHRAQTLYGSFQRIDTYRLSASDLHRNTSTVQFSDSLSLPFSISIPFFGTHRTLTRDGIQMCNWKYLSFGIATHRDQNWTVACLLRSEAFCRSHNCGHVLNLDRGRRFPEWTIVGHLSGYQPSTSSLGSIVAASPRGTRIAVANWNVISIWALEPNAFIGEDTDDIYRPSSRSESTGAVELQPIVLPLEAVCFKMRFMENEDELLTITDRGVMHWDLSPLAKGERVVHRWPFNCSLA